MNVFLCECCVLSGGGQADPPSIGVLQSVVCPVIVLTESRKRRPCAGIGVGSPLEEEQAYILVLLLYSCNCFVTVQL